MRYKIVKFRKKNESLVDFFTRLTQMSPKGMWKKYEKMNHQEQVAFMVFITGPQKGYSIPKDQCLFC